jgi:hypothetical protein
MDTSTIETRTASRHPGWDALRDPAIWAWLLVALLAILPATAALTGA